ncbi:MAG TPA: hypothetical protein VM261_11415 [Kofleriaceae bacterium]|nr:hypothetical protein [Kofleriaceae bacterium]
MGTDGDAADDDEALEGERYKGVHDLFRQARAGGFDEDPPARIDALLMAAARRHAPERHETSAGALERFRRWMVGTLMQPAVAGAVAVAVIGGAAGVLYMKGKGGVAEPTVGAESRKDHVAGVEPTRPPGPQDGFGDLPPALETTTTGRSALGSGSAATATESAELQVRLREQMAQEENQRRQMSTERDDRPKGTGSGPRGGGGGGGGGGRGADSGSGGGQARGGDVVNDPFTGEGESSNFDYRPDGRDTATVITTGNAGGGNAGGSGGTTAGTGGMVGGVRTQITTPDPPPPDGTISSDDEIVAKEHLESPKNVGSAPETTGTVRTTKPSKRTQAENLLRQARTAAKKKDCPTVRTMAKRAKQLDGTYYTNTFSRDAALKDCL